MGLSLGTGVSALAVFLQGIFSFFSPCVLPLVPLYVGYLAGGATEMEADSRGARRRMLRNTVFFVLGVSFAFFLLGFGGAALGQFFSGNRKLLAQVGGVLVVLFGLYQLGAFGGILSRERRLPFRLDKLTMSPAVALLFGFTFSFAWTPCVGPALASVLLMASTTGTAATGFALIGVYTLGFVLPFLAVGLGAGKVLELFRRHANVVKYTVKAGGVLLILMGILMLTGTMNRVNGFLAQLSSGTAQSAPATDTPPAADAPPASDAPPAADAPPTPAVDFTLLDQYGNEHTLSDYKGKTVFLNFWATWCGWCKKEMPDIEQLYLDTGKNAGDVVILGVAAPGAGDGTEDEIRTFMTENALTYPTLMDTKGEAFAAYGASTLPLTFLIDADGNVFGYVTGALSRESMDSAIAQTQAAFAAK